jgi:FdhD protein
MGLRGYGSPGLGYPQKIVEIRRMEGAVEKEVLKVELLKRVGPGRGATQVAIGGETQVQVGGTISAQASADWLAEEEPLEIRVMYSEGSAVKTENIAVTMRTPGKDEDLARGFLFTEGIIRRQDDIAQVTAQGCYTEVRLKPGVQPHLQKAQRNFYTTSSCGVCGKASIEAIHTLSDGKLPLWEGDALSAELLTGLPEALEQPIFSRTGGLHAAALFDPLGKLLAFREDVGRHNALDKLIGAGITQSDYPFCSSILLLSGRACFELVQKAVVARIPIIASIGAPSSLAVSLAQEFGVTLVGFLKRNRFNIYSEAYRINIHQYETAHQR